MHLKIGKFWILPWWSPVKPTDNVWNAGVVTDCWRFLSLVSICQLLLQSTQHERTFYNQFSLVCNQKKKKIIYNNIVQSHCEYFFNHFENKLQVFWDWPKMSSDSGRNYQLSDISGAPFVLPYLWCHTFCGGLLAPLCRPKTPDLSDQDTKITWPYLQVVYLTNLNR